VLCHLCGDGNRLMRLGEHPPADLKKTLPSLP
jgi:hypothetical protein